MRQEQRRMRESALRNKDVVMPKHQGFKPLTQRITQEQVKITTIYLHSITEISAAAMVSEYKATSQAILFKLK